MKMKCFAGVFVLVLAGVTAICQPADSGMTRLIENDLKIATMQYKYLISRVSADVMPRSYDQSNDKLITSRTDWWGSGFYTGTLWYLYENSGDTVIGKEAEKRLEILEKEKNNTGTHDLGFMMFCSFGNAFRLTGNPLYKAILNTSAASLASRYRPSIQSIQSWDSSNLFKCPVIIDNMMNLELLCWVSNNGGDKRYMEMAIKHANTTLKNHFRNDCSSFHVVDYDLNRGEVLFKKTKQGAADSSAWSRGQAWGLYGFTMMYRFTRDTNYLQWAKNIAQYIMSHPNLPEDMIPYWDFNAPGIPNTYRDASAAAIMASALLELGQYSTKKERIEYKNAAKKILVSLSSPEYLASVGENGGFLLKHSVGSLPSNSEIDVPLPYADYYFVEALMRYKQWYL